MKSADFLGKLKSMTDERAIGGFGSTSIGSEKFGWRSFAVKMN